jgi:hypothetical protein
VDSLVFGQYIQIEHVEYKLTEPIVFHITCMFTTGVPKSQVQGRCGDYIFYSGAQYFPVPQYDTPVAYNFEVAAVFLDKLYITDQLHILLPIWAICLRSPI